MPPQDEYGDGVDRRPVGREDTMDGRQQGLRGADQPSRRRRPSRYRLSVVRRPVQPGIPQTADEELEERDDAESYTVLGGDFFVS